MKGDLVQTNDLTQGWSLGFCFVLFFPDVMMFKKILLEVIWNPSASWAQYRLSICYEASSVSQKRTTFKKDFIWGLLGNIMLLSIFVLYFSLLFKKFYILMSFDLICFQKLNWKILEFICKIIFYRWNGWK